MASAFETVATAVKMIFEAEFAAEAFVMIPDNLHPALGRDRVAVGIAPVRDDVRTSNALIQETYAEVRFYDLWTDEIDPETQINPYKITGYAERLRNALRISNASDPGTGDVWYFQVVGVAYPDDPTGNKSRFVMSIRAYGNNSALIETTA